MSGQLPCAHYLIANKKKIRPAVMDFEFTLCFFMELVYKAFLWQNYGQIYLWILKIFENY